MKSKPTTPLSYADAGVDIDAGDALVDQIKPAVAATKRSGVMSAIGGFGGLFDLAATGYKDPVLVAATDGVGTKLKLAIDTGIHHTVGIDLVAMCVNDLVVQGAEPLFFLDYYACGALKTDDASAVIGGIAEGCKLAGCALIGGETAEMPGMYSKGDYDLAGFSVGAVERDAILPRKDIEAGDVLLGLASSGAHSNGFSLVRKILDVQGIGFNDTAPHGGSFAEWLLTPTRIYVSSCLAALRQSSGVKALAHITGGGLTENLPRVLPDHLAAEIIADSWTRPEIFNWLQEHGQVAASEMLRTFNCGVGMVLVCQAHEADAIAQILQNEGEDVFTIGRITARDGEAVRYV